MNEVSDFLKDLGGQEESILDKPLNLGDEPEKEVSNEVEEEAKSKNRAYRRLEKRYQQEREAGIAMAERIKVLSETDKFKADVGDDYKKLLEPIFGTADEKGVYDPKRELATKNLIAAFEGMKESAKKELLAEFQNRDSDQSNAQKEADSEVDEMLEQVEDDFGLDMSDDNVRSGFITLMEKMSPKYNDGNIKEFADPEAVAEAYVALQKRGGSNRAKELADRSMTRSGESQPSRLPQNAIDRFMEEAGLAW